MLSPQFNTNASCQMQRVFQHKNSSHHVNSVISKERLFSESKVKIPGFSQMLTIIEDGGGSI